MTRTLKMLALAALLVPLAGCAFFARSYQPNPALAELEAEIADYATIVEEERWIAILPENGDADAPGSTSDRSGVIFYPGGKVSHRAYIPLFDRIVAEGYSVFIVQMPLDLAVMDTDRALDVMEAYPDLERWHLVGHSLGGAMAAQLVEREPGAFASLSLLASYPAGGVDLSSRDLPVLSAWGTRDGVADLEAVQAAESQYPPEARMLAISGGNHAGFGVYGPQEGDNPATITGAEQRSLSQTAMLELFAAAQE